MRLPYAPNTPTDSSPETLEIYSRIEARRHPRPLIPLDLTILHTPRVADEYNSFVGALRSKTILDPALSELAICRVAVLNKAVYEWNTHAPLALKAGLQPSELQDAFSLPSFNDTTAKSTEAWRKACLTARQRAVVAYTDAMTESVVVSDDVFGELVSVGLSDREIVEQDIWN